MQIVPAGQCASDLGGGRRDHPPGSCRRPKASAGRIAFGVGEVDHAMEFCRPVKCSADHSRVERAQVDFGSTHQPEVAVRLDSPPVEVDEPVTALAANHRSTVIEGAVRYANHSYVDSPARGGRIAPKELVRLAERPDPNVNVLVEPCVRARIAPDARKVPAVDLDYHAPRLSSVCLGVERRGAGATSPSCWRSSYEALIAPIQVPQLRPNAGGVLTPSNRLAYWPANQMWPEPSKAVAS